MNSHCTPDPSIAMTLSVEHTPMSLRLPAGAVIFTVRGETWITQERVAGDIILGPGERYDVSSRAQIVISATGQSAVVHVVKPESALARCARDVHDYARHCAGTLRREAADRAASFVAHAIRSTALRLRALVTLHRRTATF
jgi:hypothetical protein